MGGRGRREVPQRLLRLEQRLAAWRRSRVPGDRIPKPLWRLAARLAVEYGLNPTAKALQLDYYSLKQHAESLSLESDSRPMFMELPSTSLPHAIECVIEFENGAGDSMRVHLKGTETPDVLALGRSFWDME